MSKQDTIRGWKDPSVRGADDADHPAGASQLSDAELTSVSGGTTSTMTITPTLQCPTSPFGPEPWCQLK